MILKQPLTTFKTITSLSNPRGTKRNFITSYSVAPIAIELRILFIAIQLIRDSKELLQNPQSAELQYMIDNFYDLFGFHYHVPELIEEYNYFVKKNRSKNVMQYSDWNGTISGLYLIKMYLEDFGTDNQIALENKIDKQLMYIGNTEKDSHVLLRSSLLYAENLHRLYNGIEDNKFTREEIRANREKFLNKYRTTTFFFKDETFEFKGGYLTLKECVKKWVTGWVHDEFFLLDEYFYMKKHDIKIEYKGWTTK